MRGGGGVIELNVIIQASGGLGLFLLGMIVMTEGLRRLAGDTMRTALMRFTKSPLSGAVTGALTTAALQSSSAMTIAAVGFVSAGLIGFPEALGVIFGANIGTTITGWLVATLGLKLKLGTIVMPLILAGVLMHLFGSKKIANTGYALAGFGLIFVGISVLQNGMAELQGIITPDFMPGDDWTGRLKLVGIGILVTVITQSSSAGVAAALTAVYAGTISFNQAAALVIGMDIGTTATALIATLGGTPAARRTGVSHVIYNLFTGAVALVLITPYTLMVELVAPGQLLANTEIVLVAFHTLFNLIGVIVVLPFTRQFAAMIEYLIKDNRPRYSKPLPVALLNEPVLALNAVQNALMSELEVLLWHTRAILDNQENPGRAHLGELQHALDETHAYLDRVRVSAEQKNEWKRTVACFHVLDHMQRLHERCEEEEYRAITARTSPGLAELSVLLSKSIDSIISDLHAQNFRGAVTTATETAARVHQEIIPLREQVMNQIAGIDLDVSRGTGLLEAIRWLDRASNHINEICINLENGVMLGGQ
jgi:phosphate:Na+ symporter